MARSCEEEHCAPWRMRWDSKSCNTLQQRAAGECVRENRRGRSGEYRHYKGRDPEAECLFYLSLGRLLGGAPGLGTLAAGTL